MNNTLEQNLDFTINKIEKEEQKLTNEQKKAVYLLSIGTFLEYFDLMLYIHMIVLLNDLFFPKTDALMAQLMSALTFCLTYLLRPIGALIFGHIGDTMGRKKTIVITTILMALSSFCMSILPTYAQIGITASYIVTLCRVVQGMSSLGEIVGAEIYLTEMIRPPKQYPMVTLIALASVIGGTAALGVASVATRMGNNGWRFAFGLGAFIAIIGYVARSSLRESADFSSAQKKIKIKLESIDKIESIDQKTKDTYKSDILDKKTSRKLFVAQFLLQCGWPVCFYFAYVHCGNILKNSYGYTSIQVINQNFVVSFFNLASYIILTFLCYKIHPLKLLKVKLAFFSLLALTCPFLLDHVVTDGNGVFCIQAFVMFFVLSSNPAASVSYSHFPIFRRFTYAGMAYAMSRVVMHIITSFGIVLLVNEVGNKGLFFIMIPMCLAYWYGINYFVKLEKSVGRL